MRSWFFLGALAGVLAEVAALAFGLLMEDLDGMVKTMGDAEESAVRKETGDG